MAEYNDIQLNGDWLLPESSDEFHEVKDFLTNCLRSVSVAQIEIYKVENSNLLLNFQKSYANQLTLPCWYDVRGDSASENGIQYICLNGFVSNTKPGLEFFNGVFSKDRIERYPEVNIILLADVAVGRSYVSDLNLLDPENQQQQLQEGFDSFYMVNSPLDRDGDNEFSLQEFQAAARFDGRNPIDYCHKYFIKDSNQAYPKYVIKFVMNEDENLECGMVGSTISSFDENFVEGANAVLIDSANFSPVSYLERNSLNTRNQRYLTIDEAMYKAIEKFKEKDAITEHKKNWLEGQLDSLDEKARQLTLNYADVLETIENTYDKTLKSLQGLIKKKLNEALSLEMELRRQLEHYSWLEHSFGRHMRNLMTSLKDSTLPEKVKTIKKLEFLRSWRNYTSRQSELSRSKSTDIKVFHSIKPDLKLEGDLFITSQADIGGMSTSTILGSSINSLTEGKNRGFASSSYLSSNFGKYISTVRPNQNLDQEFHSCIHEVAQTQYERMKDTIGMAVSDASIPFPLSLQSNQSYLIDRNKPTIDPTKVFKDAILQLTREKSGAISKGNAMPTAINFMNANAKYPADYDEEESFENDYDDSNSVVSSISSPSVREGQGPTHSRSHPLTQHQNTHTHTADSSLDDRDQRPLLAADLQTGAARQAATGVGAWDSGVVEFYASLATTHKQNSLSELGNKKIKQLQSRNISNLEGAITPLYKSNILNIEEAKILFFNIPFFSAPPALRLLYSSSFHRRTLDDLYSKAAAHKGPLILIIETKQSKFGAYLSHPLTLSGSWSGSAACFLFSITWDLKFPYHGRNAVQSNGLASFLAARESFKMGRGDLILSGDLRSGSSTLENCFGIGVVGNKDAKDKDKVATILSGSGDFQIDKLEAWSIAPGK